MSAHLLPAAYPAELSCDVLAADGSTVHIRAIRPDDGERLVEFHESLSAETVYLRFFTAHPHLTDREVSLFTTVDYHDRLALVALRSGRLVAVARYDRLAGTGDAEVAFVVGDADQGRGLGTLLLEHLAAAAARRGIDRFVAETLATNSAMQRVFRHAGFPAHQRFEDGVVKVVFPIEATPDFVAAVEGRSHAAERRSVDALFSPRSIAVVATGQSVIGDRIAAHGFTGPLQSVRPGGLHGTVDLVIADVPPERAAAVVSEASDHGARGVIVVSGGPVECGLAGALAQRELVAIARDRGVRLIGPNSVGLVDTRREIALNTTSVASPPPGPVALLSQSGAVGLVGLAHAGRSALGLSSFISIGNHADVSVNDVLAYWEDDPDTAVVCLYVESFGNPRRFAALARRVSRVKPIVALSAGCTAAGRRAASAHAAAPAHPAAPAADADIDAVLSSAGVIRVHTLTELFDTALVLAHQPLPAGARVAVVSTSGGAGVVTADACERAGLAVPALSAATVDALASVAPEAVATDNPIHLAALTPAALDVVFADPAIDAVIVVSAPPADTDVARLIDGAERHGKPALACVLGGTADGVAAGDVPCFPFPERAAAALAHAAAYRRWRDRPAAGPAIIPGTERERAERLVHGVLADRTGGRDLSAREVRELLAAYRVPTGSARPGPALAVTARNDPVLGPLLVAGLGGDGARLGRRLHRSLPLSIEDAEELAASLTAPPADGASGRSGLADAVLRIGKLVEDIPEISELSVDPIVWSPSGAVVVAAYACVAPREFPDPWLRRLS